jgi:hypothetical protein
VEIFFGLHAPPPGCGAGAPLRIPWPSGLSLAEVFLQRIVHLGVRSVYRRLPVGGTPRWSGSNRS